MHTVGSALDAKRAVDCGVDIVIAQGWEAGGHVRGTVATMPLVDAAISTSGDYERYFEADGVRHHHILDPKTGKSATGARGVTIIGPDATTTEGISKSVFIMGPERGIRFAESLPGIDAVIIDTDGEMHYTAGLRRETRQGTSESAGGGYGPSD